MIDSEKYFVARCLKRGFFNYLLEAKTILDMPEKEWKTHLEKHSTIEVEDKLLFFVKCSQVSYLIDRAIEKIEEEMDELAKQEER